MAPENEDSKELHVLAFARDSSDPGSVHMIAQPFIPPDTYTDHPEGFACGGGSIEFDLEQFERIARAKYQIVVHVDTSRFELSGSLAHNYRGVHPSVLAQIRSVVPAESLTVVEEPGYFNNF
jgi:hypothetical protein